jgi:hypothetical protein
VAGYRAAAFLPGYRHFGAEDRPTAPAGRQRLYQRVGAHAGHGRGQEDHPANDAFLDTFGYSAEELLGKLPRAIHAEAQDPACDRAIWAELYEKGSWTGEMLTGKRTVR